MSWIEGIIEEFKGNDPRHRELRKIRTDPAQSWEDLYFFHLSRAREAGYPDAELVAGRRIQFEPDPQADRPAVLRFKPFERRESQAAVRPVPTRTFLNPYHFVPLAAPSEDSLVEADKVLEKGTLHDRFGGEGVPRYSGRIVCRLETEGPVVVGAQQRRVGGDPEEEKKEDKEQEILPFGLTDPAAPDDPYRRTPMIPGSTLRGLVSSIVEAASCSTLRVLPERTFTRRADIVGEALSAVGLLVEENGGLRLEPLALSVMEMTRAHPAPQRERCRVLLNAYRFDHDEKRTMYSAGSFLDKRRPQSWSSSNRKFWYLDLKQTDWYWKERKGKKFCLGLMTKASPIPEPEWAALDPKERQRYTRGLLLVLGLDGSKAGNLPPDKKHEYFIPYPAGPSRNPSLEIPARVLEEFRSLADIATDIPRGGEANDLPFLHAGRIREENGVRPQAGDLVYFDTDSRGQVSRIAFSAIWRRPIPGSLHEAVGRISPHLVPLHAGRDKLTLAEQLFGFVEQKGKERALAGRLRFAHALVEGEPPEGGWYEPAVTLNVLASPKPPSPALYFGNEGYLAKRALDLDRHVPQGRKFYLHHRQQDIENRSYETGDPADKRNLKALVRPLRCRTRFLFHIDFENLTREDLGYLLYALRPTPEFRHKLGMAKPLGLGRVRIDPLALCFIDRKACYQPDSLFALKYQGVESRLAGEEAVQLSPPLAHRYRHEVEALAAAGPAAEAFPRWNDLVDAVHAKIPEMVWRALELLGNPNEVHVQVTYPVLQGQDTEGEHFQWFVENDKVQKKALEAIPLEGGLPTLERYQQRPRERRGR